MALFSLPLPSIHFHLLQPSAIMVKTSIKRNELDHFRQKFIKLQSRVGMCIKASAQTDNGIVRQSANYQPPMWKDEFIQALDNQFQGETYRRRFNKVKGEVKKLVEEKKESLEQLQLIDVLQRLGISNHFDDEINNVLQTLSNNNNNNNNNLYATSLRFRLLRQHQFQISQEVFNVFKDEMGNSRTSMEDEDYIDGVLSLYEASFLSKEGEDILEMAKGFAIGYLKEYTKSSKDEVKVEIVKNALKLPLHWRISRIEAKLNIDMYEREGTVNPILLEMAKLDFNMVQSIYQDDLKFTSTWWRSTNLGEKLGFARDQLMENFIWTIGTGPQVELRYFRRMGTKLVALITMIDDIYDVYGTLHELQLFTDAIHRWDMEAIDELPEYMKECFLALYNSINEIASEALSNHGVDVMPYLKKTWVDLCNSYLVEAKWYESGYKPTFEEYINNSWISVAGPIMLIHSYVFVSFQVTIQELEILTEYSDLIRWPSTIMRLANDLLTPLDQQNIGDVPKSIQCYVNETGASENDAREYIQNLIDELWKKLNEFEDEKLASSPIFIEMSINLARIAQYMYQYGDGYAIDQNKAIERVVSLLVTPIVINK